MKVAVLGGSFNPPHICHVFISCYVLATLDIDQLWFVPCYEHAFGKELVSFHHRFTMCCMAVESLREDLVKVLSIEKDRHGTSWTIDTVCHLRASYPDHEFTWVIGSDVLDELDKWKDFEQLQQLISFIVVPRAGFSLNIDRLQSNKFQEVGANTGCVNEQKGELRKFLQDPRRLKNLREQMSLFDALDFQLPNISSSLIRERVRQNQPISHLVPKKIQEYIRTHKLYQAQCL